MEASQKEQKKSFVHLHVHSHYSLLDGLNKIDKLVETAKKFGMPALALTDHGAMYGAIEFYKECKGAGIKPIIGVEAYVAPRSRFDKDPNLDNRRWHLTLLAKNNVGYKNLIKLTTVAHLEGFYYKPRIDKEILKQHSEGIICLSGCPGSELGSALRANDIERGKTIVKEFLAIFGKENYFLELMHHPEVEGNENWKKNIKILAEEFGLKIVGTQDSHYLHSDDKEAHNTLVAINTGADGSGNKGMGGLDGDYSFIDPETATKFFSDIPGAVENTLFVADLCDLEIELGKLYFPEFKLNEGEEANEVLRAMAMEGFDRIGLDKTNPEFLKRLDYELEIIKMKGYPSYFLVVADLMRFARENKILTNTRGSAAGSLVSYLCGITSVDPMYFNLPFERFLNPYRPSAPDVDMDIADNRRDELIEYARKKYGEDRVAQIGTFGTMMARGSVRDVARALGFPYNVGDTISKMIPMGSQGFPMTIDHAMELVPDLQAKYDTERETKEILDLARKIEGSARHISVHAAGVVISPKPMTEFTPVQLDPKGGKIITQYDMYSIEDAGLPKFDFLGIRNLAFLAESVELVEKLYGIVIDLEKIAMDDKKTFEMLARGETEGVFQLNGSGMTQKLVRLKPTNIHDINVMVALYRPGPMQTIDEYIARKHGEHKVIFYHPKMESYLGTTYGLLVYQDDLLFTAIELAGYDWGEVDKFRKAVGKKIPEEMAKQHVKFVEGAMKHSGVNKQFAEQIWDLFEPFQGYGFNKAHAASYGKLSYQTAYMKANYPVAYMAAMLTAESGDVDTIGIYVHEANRLGIKVLPPDVNESFGGFTMVQENEKSLIDSRLIRFGLYTIKNLGKDIADAIIAERKKNGKFTSLENFLERVTHKNVTKKSLEALIKSGALDIVGERGNLLANMETLLEFNKEHAKQSNQISLFADMGQNFISRISLQKTEPATMRDILNWEKDLLGLYVSGHPLDRFRDKIESSGMSIKKIKEEMKNGMPITFAAIIDTAKSFITKKNERMAFLGLSDLTGSIEAVVFPRLFKEQYAAFEPDKVIAIQGKVTLRNEEKSIAIDAVKIL